MNSGEARAKRFEELQRELSELQATLNQMDARHTDQGETVLLRFIAERISNIARNLNEVEEPKHSNPRDEAA